MIEQRSPSIVFYDEMNRTDLQHSMPYGPHVTLDRIAEEAGDKLIRRDELAVEAIHPEGGIVIHGIWKGGVHSVRIGRP